MSARPGPTESIAVLVVIVSLLGFGAYSGSQQLQSRRTGAAFSAKFDSNELRATSRLWQDPFEALPSPQDPAASTTNWSTLSRNDLQDRLIDTLNASASSETRALLLPVLLPGEDFAESAERRMRDRYAVVSALLHAGLVPDDADHLRLLLPSPHSTNPTPLYVPYETFSLPPAAQAESTLPVIVCVLWLNDLQFGGKHIYRRLESLRTDVEVIRDRVPATPWNWHGRLDWAIIGPTSSDELHILYENKDWPTRMRCISPSATMKPPANAALAHNIVRTVVTDDRLVSAAIKELEWRIPPASSDDITASIAIVYEADTAYGRALADEFLTQLDPTTPADPTKHRPKFLRESSRIEAIPYYRGIDGMTPSDAAAPADPSRKPSAALLAGKPSERPAGRAQLDYLRRLTDRIARLKQGQGNTTEVRAIGIVGSDVYDKLLILQAMRARFPGTVFFTTDLDARLLMPDQFPWCRSLIVASGFGLELNQTLQGNTPPFRDSYQTSMYLAVHVAVTRLQVKAQENLHPRIFEIGRNGAFDLTPTADGLRPFDPPSPLQARPPLLKGPGLAAAIIFILFALFIILAHDVSRSEGRCRLGPAWRSRGRLFTAGLVLSIGIALAFLTDSQPSPAIGLPLLLGSLAVASVPTRWLRYPYFALPHRLVASLDGSSALMRLLRSSAALALTILIVGIPLYTLITHTSIAEGGEPWSLTEGLSVWPTEVIRIVAALLALYWCVRVLTDLNVNADEITENFQLSPAAPPPPAPASPTPPPIATPALVNGAMNYLQIHLGSNRSTRRIAVRALLVSLHLGAWFTRHSTKLLALIRREQTSIVRWNHPHSPVTASNLWQEYLVRSLPTSQALRVGFFTLGYVLFAAMIFKAIPMPLRPVRGDLAFTADKLIVIVSSTVVAMLTFLVWDSTRLFDRFVKLLTSTNATIYSKQSRKQAGGRTGHLASSWLDIQLIAHRSDTIGRTLYYPMTALLLLLVARSKLFDNWEWGLPLLLIHLATSSIAVMSAWSLRNSASKARRLELDRLTKREARLLSPHRKSPKDEAELKQLRHTIDEIRNINEGAFAPWRSHPVFGAVLVPASGAGALILIDLLQNWSTRL